MPTTQLFVLFILCKYMATAATYLHNVMQFFFIVAPCIFIYVEFTHQQMHFIILKTH